MNMIKTCPSKFGLGLNNWIPSDLIVYSKLYFSSSTLITICFKEKKESLLFLLLKN